MHQLFYFSKVFFLLLFLVGCSVKVPTPQENDQKIQALTKMLLDENQHVDKKEAEDLAQSSVYYAQKLAHNYELVSPPLWQNTLVNFGLKKRGLCYQWANDLWAYLKAKKYKSLKFYYIGSDVGSYFEHNAISVSSIDNDINSSIVLDAWRDSGRLFFIEIYKDKKYKWKERFDL